MSQPFLISFKPEISLQESSEENQLVIQSPERKLTFKKIHPNLKNAISSLAEGSSTLSQLLDILQQGEEKYPILKFYTYLQKFSQEGWLCHSVVESQQPMAMAIPMGGNYQFSYQEVTPLLPYSLSRFAYCHQVGGEMVLESPLSQTKILLLSWENSAIINLLAKPQTGVEIVEKIRSIAPETVQQFLSLLLTTKMLSEVLAEGKIQEETNIPLMQWEFHDLLFHTRSRLGRHDAPYGGTYRFLGKIDPLPGVKPPMSEEVIKLEQPDISSLTTTDVSFTQVLERRKSIREYGKTPITKQQLGEFLYRTGRIKNTRQTELGELSERVYPSGGAIYELEMYPIVHLCEGISSGLYHYCPQKHQLYGLSGATDPVARLLNNARMTMGNASNPPQVLIILAARFQRLAWKYQSMSYGLLLKHVGVLYQTMYLVATAMDLAPCALGGGDSDLFTQALGLDYYTETSVGEFGLGSKK